MDKLDKLIVWTCGGDGGRSVDIRITGGICSGLSPIEIWLYDRTLMTGQHIDLEDIECLDSIDLKRKKEQEEREVYEALKEKFEKQGEDEI